MLASIGSQRRSASSAARATVTCGRSEPPTAAMELSSIPSAMRADHGIPVFGIPLAGIPRSRNSTNPESTNPEFTNRRSSGLRAPSAGARKRGRDDSLDDVRALRALTRAALLDRVALAIQQERGQAETWLLGLIRQGGGKAAPVLRAVERCLTRIEAGDAGGHSRHNAAYIDKAVRQALGLPSSKRRGAEAAVGDIAGGIIGNLRRRS